jgi:serine/threonine protein kinase
MGPCNSKPTYIACATGGEREYHERYHESSTTLGQGMFGTVKLIHDVTNKDLLGSTPLAVKYVKKGYTFRDNILYTPMKKEALVGEVEILRRLNGECYNLTLVAVYESPSTIYMVTEYCAGGEMMPWVSTAFSNSQGDGGDGLRTEDVSRIAHQLWSAVHHCAKH